MNVFRKLPDSERNIKATLYFGNVDAQANEVLMYELFVQFGPIKSLNMPKDRILGTHQGFGFVEYKSVADADYTLEILKGVRLYGKHLRLKKADLKTNTSTSQGVAGAGLLSPHYIDVGAKVFINNLNPMVDSQFLYDTFLKFGTLIKRPEVQIDSQSGESQGYAFITFQDFSASDKAIEKMNGSYLMNSKVRLTYAFKEDASGKKVAHGDSIERKLAENAKANKVIVTKKKKGRVEKPRKAK